MDGIGFGTAENASTADYDPSKDPKRKAKSKDPGWKYAFWPDLADKNLVRCSLCRKDTKGGIKRIKQHLVGGYGDVAKCLNTTVAISREMQEAIMRNKKRKLEDLSVPVEVEIEGQLQSNLCSPPTQESQASTQVTLTPSSGAAAEENKAVIPLQVRGPMDAYVRRIPEDVVVERQTKSPTVVVERQTKSPTQTAMENHFRSDVERNKTCSYIVKWIYESGIPFTAVNRRSFEEMVEAIGRFGPGLKPPTYHEVRVTFLKDEKDQTEDMRKKYEEYWKTYGCTLMLDGWKDKRGRHLINFLVNCPEGTYFMGSVDASGQVQDANMLFKLLDNKIEEIGENHVIQVVTENGSNYVAASRLLMEKRTRLYWTPCAAHCIELMLEDIGNLRAYKAVVTKARRMTSFIYRHPRLLEAVRAKIGGKDLVMAGVTRFTTSFMTLQSLLKYKGSLMQLFVSEDWINCNLSVTEVGKKVDDRVFDTIFWNDVQDCLTVSDPLLVVLRMIYADERPATAEVYMAMEEAKKKIKQNFRDKEKLAKKKIKQNFGDKEKLCKTVINIIDRRWECQMDRPLYAAAFFLNPGKYFDYCGSQTVSDVDLCKIYAAFNKVIIRLVPDGNLQDKIMAQSEMYKESEGMFSSEMAIRQRKSMTPILWWKVNGVSTSELRRVALCIVGLCCSSSSCERNWSTFEFIHNEKRNRLEHQHLNDLVYIQYNRRLKARFKDRCEHGKSNDPLQLDELGWSSEWMTGQSDEELVHHGDNLTWGDVDKVVEVSTALECHNLPRRADTNICYTCRGKGKATVEESSDEGELEEEEDVNDDVDIDDDFGQSTGPRRRQYADLLDDYDFD